MVPRMGTERPVPRICVGRLHHPDLEAHHGTSIGMCACAAGPWPDCVLGHMGEGKTCHSAGRLRVSWLGRFDGE
jgi:hypothetical protein